jgi:hypothetical protein
MTSTAQTSNDPNDRPAATSDQSAAINLESIARVAHAANAAFNVAIGQTQLPWELVGEGVLRGVVAIAEGTVRTPGDSHAAWLRDHEAAGWTYGPVKDPEAKTHPCMLPFAALPYEEQQKDVLFFAIVRALLGYRPL